MITTPFGVSEALIEPLAEDRDFLRYVLMEKPPTDKVRARLSRDKDLQYAYGAVLGEIYTFRNGEPTARKPIREFELDKWLLKEDHYRHGGGFVFFVHTKFLIIDALSDDPLLCSGSANFSPGSILSNDENILLFRGNQRVTDIFLTEFDRIFRHFYIRKTINENAGELDLENKVAFLEETSAWTDKHFLPGSFSSRRREMFFADPAKTWVTQAMEHR
jgi:phosphatidylserine/phosphatidylglycerophosphate/cardiolipin synthase-like enzyme